MYETREFVSEEVQVTRAAGIIALGSVASRALGVVREIVKAELFGATGQVGALEVALRVPTLLYDLLVGGMINSALVPVFSDYAVPERRTELWRLLSALLSLAIVVLSACVVVGELLAPQIVWLMAGGLAPEWQAEAARLLRMMLPAVVFLNVAGIVAGALYALKRFEFPAFTAAVYNAAMVVAACLLGRRWGVASMALGLLVGAVLQLVLQWPGLRDARLRWMVHLRHPALQRIAGLYVPIALGLLVDMLGVALSYNLASRTGERSIPWMQYSATLIQFPLGLVSIAVSIAILPTLSRHAADHQADAFCTTLMQGLKLVLVLTIPATVGLWVLAKPLVELVFEHGDFTALDTQGTVAALRYHLVGLIFAAVDQPLVFAFYARKDTWTPALVGVATVGLYIVMALLPTLFVPLSLGQLILANSLKWAAHAFIMLMLFRRRVGRLGGHGVWALVGKASLASLAMGGVVYGLQGRLARAVSATPLGELVQVGMSGLVGTVAYIAVAGLLRIREIGLLGQALLGLKERLSRGWPPAIIRTQRPRQGAVTVRVNDEKAQPVCSACYDEAYFLTSCEGYEEFLAGEGAHLSRRLSQALAAAKVEPGMRVLDVGCGRGEVLRHCAALGAHAVGIDYAPVAVRMAQRLIRKELEDGAPAVVYQADAKHLPFSDASFDRVLMFDLVEHLQPWELAQALSEARRVLRPGGRLIIHTAPNAWYDRWAYPVVRLVRRLMGQGERYPANPRALVPANLDVHVNEQSGLSLWRWLRRMGFRPRVWLDTPPQHRQEGLLLQAARYILFSWPPFRWFFEREVFAVAEKVRD